MRLVIPRPMVVFYSLSPLDVCAFLSVVVIQATTDRVLDVLDEAKGDIQVVIVELRSQSLSHVGRSRRPSSRSMEDFLTTMNSNISGFSSSSERRSSLSGASSFLASSPPSESTFKSRLSWSSSSSSSQAPASSQSTTTANLLDLGSPRGTSSSSSSISQGSATTSTTAPSPAMADPFAGNDIRGLETRPAEEKEELSEDPFACLM